MDDSNDVVYGVLPAGGRVRCTRELAHRLGVLLDDSPVKAPESPAEELEEVSESQPTTERPKAVDVRAWAKEKNIECNARGKLPEALYQQYAEAH